MLIILNPKWSTVWTLEPSEVNDPAIYVFSDNKYCKPTQPIHFASDFVMCNSNVFISGEDEMIQLCVFSNIVFHSYTYHTIVMQNG